MDIAVKISEHLGITVDDLLFDTPSLSETDRELLNIFGTLPENEQQRFIGRCSEIAARLRESKDNKIHRIKMITMPIADIAAGAGVSTPLESDDLFTMQRFPENEIPSNADCGIPINGDSMEPEYPDGCIVWVKKGSDNVKYGDTVIAIFNGSPLCKIYRKSGLYSYNKNYPPYKINDGDSISIFGKVVGKYIE